MSANRLVDLPSIRRLALRDITSEVLRALIDHGEDLVVERKREPPRPPAFGAEAASFANTIGGLILIGVNDDRTIHGWKADDRMDLQSHLGQLLRAQTDPLPPFVADRFELDGKPLVVMRVFESADAPHLVRGTGALYVRTSAGKVPVDEQRMLLALATRRRDAELDAQRRLDERMVIHSLGHPDGPPPNGPQDALQVTVRAAPLTVPPTYTRWPMMSIGAAWASAAASAMTPQSARLWAAGMDPAAAELSTWPEARGVVARSVAEDRWHGGTAIVVGIAVAHSSGVLGVAQRKKHGRRATLPLEDIEAVVQLAVGAIEDGLRTSETFGRAAWRLTVRLHHQGGVSGQLRPPRRVTVIAGESTVPASDEERSELVAGFIREYGRACGFEHWEA